MLHEEQYLFYKCLKYYRSILFMLQCGNGMETSMNEKRAMNMAVGMCIGEGIGAVIALVLRIDYVIGLLVGMNVGMIIGLLLKKKEK